MISRDTHGAPLCPLQLAVCQQSPLLHQDRTASAALPQEIVLPPLLSYPEHAAMSSVKLQNISTAHCAMRGVQTSLWL